MEDTQKTVTGKEGTFAGIVKPVLVLLLICVVCGALLAWLNQVTAPLITENERLATQEAFLAVLPEGTDAGSLETLTVSAEGVVSAVKSPDGQAADGSPVDAVSGASYSSEAVLGAVNAAMSCYNDEIKGALE